MPCTLPNHAHSPARGSIFCPHSGLEGRERGIFVATLTETNFPAVCILPPCAITLQPLQNWQYIYTFSDNAPPQFGRNVCFALRRFVFGLRTAIATQEGGHTHPDIWKVDRNPVIWGYCSLSLKGDTRLHNASRCWLSSFLRFLDSVPLHNPQGEPAAAPVALVLNCTSKECSLSSSAVSARMWLCSLPASTRSDHPLHCCAVLLQSPPWPALSA